MACRDRFRVILLLLIVSCPAFCQAGDDLKKCDSAPSVPWSQVEGEVIQRGEVQIPPLGTMARIQGVVRIEICVSETGAVVQAKPISGHPLLVPAAVESAKKWRFKARMGPFKTTLEVSFLLGGTPSQIANEEKASSRFFEEDGKCRDRYRNKEFDQALVLCKSALDLAAKLPKERVNERRLAYEIVGHVYFAERKFDEALQDYRTELQIALETLQPYEAELGYAYHDVALACHSLGRFSEAALNYARAEQTMSQAREHIGLAELKPKYSATLKQIREHYLILLQQTGQTAAASDLEKRIQAEPK